MFGTLHRDQEDPSSRDVGKFLNEDELLEWHRSMQRKYPHIFTADDQLFGPDGRQHAMGTKLMTYFDNDPAKPMRVEVRGSRWKIEFGDKSPVYVVSFQGDSELTQIELTSAHEEAGWKVGWNIPPPTS